MKGLGSCVVYIVQMVLINSTILVIEISSVISLKMERGPLFGKWQIKKLEDVDAKSVGRL